MYKKLIRKFLGTIFLSAAFTAIDAAENELDRLKNQCENITVQQRQMAKAAGYDLDSLCSQIPSDISNRPVTQPVNVTPRSVQPQSNPLPDTINNNEDRNLLKERSTRASLSRLKLKPFGYDLFAGVPSTFAPATDIPVPADYLYLKGFENRENPDHNRRLWPSDVAGQ